MVPAEAEALVPEAVIGAAGDAESGERIKATLVVLFPPQTDGKGEGYLGWNLGPDSTMRHGIVRNVTSGPEGRIVQIAYPQGGTTVVIPPGAAIMALQPGEAGLLKKGARISAPAAERQAENSYAAEAVAVAKDGFKPPM